VFHKNNEMAATARCTLQITGSTGMYGRRLRVAVIGFGATARGAATALGAHGIHDVDIFTNRA
jgi:glutamyl-tRNA reductase